MVNLNNKLQSFKVRVIPLFFFTIIFTMLYISAFNAPLPLGDEANYIHQALSGDFKKIKTNIYLITYRLVLIISSMDPVIAHYIMRFLTSLLAVLGMALFLISFGASKESPAFFISIIIWASTYIVSPPAQFGNINLYAFGIVSLSAIPFLRKKTVFNYIILLTSIFWISQIREEYYISLFLLLLYGAYLYLLVSIKNSFKINLVSLKRNFHVIIAIMFFLLSVAYFALFKVNICEHNFSLCFGQHYSVYYLKKHPELTFSAMAEYEKVLKHKFDGRTDFFSILLYDPLAVSEYFLVNTIKNLIILIPAVLRHRIFLFNPFTDRKAEIMQILFLMLTIIPGFLIFYKKITANPLIKINTIFHTELYHKIIVSFILAAAVIIPLFLLVPDSRYYAPAAPIIFMFLYLSFSYELKLCTSKFRWLIIFLFIVIFGHPLLIKEERNQKLIKEIKTYNTQFFLHKNSVLIGGLYPSDIATFSFGTNFTTDPNHITKEKLLNKEYDYIVVNKYLRSSSIWSQERILFSDFEKNPRSYGYVFLGRSNDKHDTTVYGKIINLPQKNNSSDATYKNYDYVINMKELVYKLIRLTFILRRGNFLELQICSMATKL